MYKITRGDIPQVLKEKAEEWTQRLLEKRNTDKSYFYWPTYRGEKLNHILQKPLLDDMTRQHCAFCDGFFEQSPVLSIFSKLDDIFYRKPIGEGYRKQFVCRALY